MIKLVLRMENLTVSVQVVLPLLLMMLTGVVVKKLGWADEAVLKQMDKITYRVFMPTLIFYNIYSANSEQVFNPRLLLFAIFGILTVFILSMILIPLLTKDNGRRGAIVQNLVRTNLLIFGLSIATSLYGDRAISVVSMVSCVAVPLYNTLAVVILEFFRSGKIRGKDLLSGLIKNPLIIASVISISFLLLKIHLPSVLAKTVKDMANVVTPLCLLTLGASLRLGDIRTNKKYIFWATFGRLVAVPSIFIPLAVQMGFRNVELTALMVLFATPTAVSGYTLASQMNSDSKLAGQLVASTTVFSVVTLFGWTFLLRTLGLI